MVETGDSPLLQELFLLRCTYWPAYIGYTQGIYTNSILLIDSSQNFIIFFAERICLATGGCKLACAVSLFTVPSIPLQSNLLWLVVKNFQTQSTEKSFYGDVNCRNACNFVLSSTTIQKVVNFCYGKVNFLYVGNYFINHLIVYIGVSFPPQKPL